MFHVISSFIKQFINKIGEESTSPFPSYNHHLLAASRNAFSSGEEALKDILPLATFSARVDVDGNVGEMLPPEAGVETSTASKLELEWETRTEWFNTKFITNLIQ